MMISEMPPSATTQAIWSTLKFLALLGIAGTGISTGHAQEFVYDPDRSETLVACDRLHWSGEKSASQQCYSELAETSNDILIRAESAWATGDLAGANQMFRRAIELDPDNPHLKTRWGRLFIQTYQEADAVELFREVLATHPEHYQATMGIALAMSVQFGGGAQEQLDQALNNDPDLMDGYLLNTRFALDLNQYETAEAYLEGAENLAERYNWPSLEIHALRAAAALLQDEDPQPWIDLSLQDNPAWGGVYELQGDYYLMTYRYREAVDAFRKAVEIEPERWTAHSKLGINLLRRNQVQEAQHHLEIAYSGDAYDPATVNTLRLLDTFDEYDLITGEVELEQYSTESESGEKLTYRVPVLWRLHQSERQMLEPYVRQLTTESIQTFSERYRFKPLEPIVIELYPNHDDFAVRTVSTPGVGLLGVTFGYLFAMDSPTAGRPGDFHWGSVLWHEMAHVFTVSASNHRVPRWFTEGVSMFEEWQTGPSPGVKVPAYFLEALAAQRLLPIAELDSGFVRPTYETQIMVSYNQAGLLCQYLSEEWGQEKLVEILYRFPAGDTVEEAISEVLGYPIDIVDDLFTTWLDTKFSEVIANFDEWNEMRSAMREAFAAEAWDEVIKGADISIGIYPEYVEEDSPYLYKALALDEKEQTDLALKTLELYYAMGGHNALGLSKLADLLIEQQRYQDAADVLQSLNYIAPQDHSVHSRLAETALKIDRPEIALVEYGVLLSLAPHDRASLLLGKAKAYSQLGEYSSARRQLLMALEIAPHYREAQQLLLEISTQINSQSTDTSREST